MSKMMGVRKKISSTLSVERSKELLETGKLKNMDGHHEPSISSGGSLEEKIAIAENPEKIVVVVADTHHFAGPTTRPNTNMISGVI